MVPKTDLKSTEMWIELKMSWIDSWIESKSIKFDWKIKKHTRKIDELIKTKTGNQLKCEFNRKWDESTVESSRNQRNSIEKLIEIHEKYENQRKNR